MGNGKHANGCCSYLFLSITHYSLLITNYSLLITHYPLLITHYSSRLRLEHSVDQPERAVGAPRDLGIVRDNYEARADAAI